MNCASNQEPGDLPGGYAHVPSRKKGRTETPILHVAAHIFLLPVSGSISIRAR